MYDLAVSVSVCLLGCGDCKPGAVWVGEGGPQEVAATQTPLPIPTPTPKARRPTRHDTAL